MLIQLIPFCNCRSLYILLRNWSNIARFNSGRKLRNTIWDRGGTEIVLITTYVRCHCIFSQVQPLQFTYQARSTSVQIFKSYIYARARGYDDLCFRTRSPHMSMASFHENDGGEVRDEHHQKLARPFSLPTVRKVSSYSNLFFFQKRRESLVLLRTWRRWRQARTDHAVWPWTKRRRTCPVRAHAHASAREHMRACQCWLLRSDQPKTKRLSANTRPTWPATMKTVSESRSDRLQRRNYPDAGACLAKSSKHRRFRRTPAVPSSWFMAWPAGGCAPP
jgi:hypothetical protein